MTALSIGPIHENSLECETNLQFRPELFELKHLKSITFFSCFTSLQHSVTIHNERWEKLAASLESLELRSNPSLIGKIPTSFTSLTKLQSLVLLENRLTDKQPQKIGNLTKLKRLVVSGNSLTGQIPYSLDFLRDLLILDFSRNSLTGPLPSTLCNLALLVKLDLSNNKLNGKLPEELVFLKSLTLLDLRNNRLGGGLSKTVEKMYALEEIVLSNNPIGGGITSVEWKILQNLVILDLSSAGLIREVPEYLSELKKLQV